MARPIGNRSSPPTQSRIRLVIPPSLRSDLPVSVPAPTPIPVDLSQYTEYEDLDIDYGLMEYTEAANYRSMDNTDDIYDRQDPYLVFQWDKYAHSLSGHFYKQNPTILYQPDGYYYPIQYIRQHDVQYVSSYLARYETKVKLEMIANFYNAILKGTSTLKIPYNLVQSVFYKGPTGLITSKANGLAFRLLIYGRKIYIDDKGRLIPHNFVKTEVINKSAFDTLEFIIKHGGVLLGGLDSAQYSDSWELGTHHLIDFIAFSENDRYPLKSVITTPPKSGNFFTRVNTSAFDLKKYQIFTVRDYEQGFNDVQGGKLNASKHCLIHTLEYWGVTPEEITGLSGLIINDVSFNTNRILQICHILKRAIRKHYYSKKGIESYTYGDEYKDKEPIEIAVYDNHIFPYEVVPYTKFFVEKYFYSYDHVLNRVRDNSTQEEADKVNMDFEDYVNYMSQQIMMKYMITLIEDSSKDSQGNDYFPFKYDDKGRTIGYNDGSNQLYNNLSLIIELDKRGCFEHHSIIERQAEYQLHCKDIRVQDYSKYLPHLKQCQKEYKPKLKSKTKQTVYDIFVLDVESDVNTVENGYTHLALMAGIKELCVDNYTEFDFRRKEVVRSLDPLEPLEEKEYDDGVALGILEFIYKSMVRKPREKGVYRQVMVYTHNVKYDLHTLFRDFKGPDLEIRSDSFLQNGGVVYRFLCKYKDINIEFRDSYKMYSQKLADFQRDFNLPADMGKKSFAAFKAFSRNNKPREYQASSISFEEYFNMLDPITFDLYNTKYVKMTPREKQWQDFLKSITDFGNKYPESVNWQKQTFDHWKYFSYYLEYDVKLLEEGLKAFDYVAQQKWGQSIFDSLTISSMADTIIKNSGGYDGIYTIGGRLRKYCSFSIRGGICTVNPKIQGKVNQINMIALDANSEYPSAMVEIRDVYGGLPKGPAKHYKNYQEFLNLGPAKKVGPRFLNLEQFKASKYYQTHQEDNNPNQTGVNAFMVLIKITKINKNQQIPFICHRNSKGILDYLNKAPVEAELDSEGQTIVDEEGNVIYHPAPILLTNIELENYIMFQEIEYEWVEGIYWNEGVNPIQGDIIEDAYTLRLEAKIKGEDGKATVLKLFMNGSYGKTILKVREYETLIVKNSLLEKFLYNYQHIIVGVPKTMNEDYTLVKRRSYDDAYTMPHVGSLILAMSKRILYRVLDICTDLQVLVTYLDTDSLRLEASKINQVKEEYRRRYNLKIRDFELKYGKNYEQDYKDYVELCGQLNISQYETNYSSYKNFIDSLDQHSKIYYKDIIKKFEQDSKDYDTLYKKLKSISYLDQSDIIYIKDQLSHYYWDPQIIKELKECWKKDLVGDDLGQFKHDLKLEYFCEDKGQIVTKKAKDVVGYNGIVAGKKNYLDLIRGIDHMSEYIYSHYKRAKGVSKQAMDYKCTQEYCPVFIKKNPRLMSLLNYINKDLNRKPYTILGETPEAICLYRKDIARINRSYPKLPIMDREIIPEEYFNLVETEPFPINLKHTSSDFPGDILEMYKDICYVNVKGEIPGIDIENIIPGGKPFFNFDFGVGVQTRVGYMKNLKMTLAQDEEAYQDLDY